MAESSHTTSRARAALFAAGAAALTAEAVTHLVDFGVYDLRLRLLDSAYEWSLSHLLATGAFAVGAVACAVGATPAKPRRRAWAAGAGLFAFLLADNVTRLHEHVSFWPVVYAPVLLALSVSVVLVAEGTELDVVVYSGLGLLVGSLAVHVLGPPVVRTLGWGPDGWAYQVKVAIKEGTELAGWVLVVPALARLAVRRCR
jgi:hypothetical protein